MIEVKIPGREKALRIQTVALDYNGTIAADGVLLPAAAERIRELSTHVDICVLTADTYGTVMQQCRELGVAVKTFPQEGAAVCKEAIVRKLGSGVCAVGNGSRCLTRRSWPWPYWAGRACARSCWPMPMYWSHLPKMPWTFC